MAGDALLHLIVVGMGGGDEDRVKSPGLGGRLDLGLCKGALARPRAADDKEGRWATHRETWPIVGATPFIEETLMTIHKEIDKTAARLSRAARLSFRLRGDADPSHRSAKSQCVMLSRRNLLKVLAASQILPFTPSAASAARTKIELGPDHPFSFEILKDLAAQKAAAPYILPPMPDPVVLKQMNFDVAKSITFNLDDALYGRGEGAYPIIFLTVGQIFLKSVTMYTIDGDTAREIVFKPDYFTHPADSPLTRLAPEPSPFAGFEVRQAFDNVALREHEGWARFIGASYFRAVGESNQFGLSARALAQNTGVANPEEFPDFTHFWITEGKSKSDPVVVYALLDGPSVAGAYRFIMHRGRATTMDITFQLHLRKPIERLGIAPLTSMFWFSETVKGAGVDWRPEVHDSDGLALWTSKDEHVWRPLNDPEKLSITTFEDENPRGFGLMQRATRSTITTSMKCDTSAGRAVGSSRSANGAKARYSLSRSRQTTRSTTTSSRCGCRRSRPRPDRRSIIATTSFGATKTRFLATSRSVSRPVSGRAPAEAPPGPTSSAISSSSSKARPSNRSTRTRCPNPSSRATHGHFQLVWMQADPNGAPDHWRVRFDFDPEGQDVVDLQCVLRLDGKPLTETWHFRLNHFTSPVR